MTIDIDQLEALAKAAHNDGWEHAYAPSDRWQDILALIAEVRALREERNQAILDAERARNERNRVGVEIRREWMSKCEALREDAEPTDEMIRVGLAIQWPALYRDGLFSEYDGAGLRAETERRIAMMRQQYLAMRAAHEKEPK